MLCVYRNVNKSNFCLQLENKKCQSFFVITTKLKKRDSKGVINFCASLLVTELPMNNDNQIFPPCATRVDVADIALGFFCHPPALFSDVKLLKIFPKPHFIRDTRYNAYTITIFSLSITPLNKIRVPNTHNFIVY